MKSLSAFLCLCFAFITTETNKYLLEIPNFQNQSIFKKDIYRICGSFDQISVTDAANKIVNPDSFDIHLLNACVFYATLKVREKNKRNPLKISEPATMSASLWASIMAKEKTFLSHVHPTRNDVKTHDKRMAIFDSQFKYNTPCSENCCYTLVGRITYKDLATRAINQWLDSPGHKRNMLSNQWEYLGCGSGISKHPEFPNAYYAYFVQNFH